MVQTLPSQKRQIATKAITIRVVTSTEEEAGTYLTMTPGVIDLSGAKAPIGGARPLSN
ncbi:hypothetical protein [uncultured Devosia sp.]|uniref:hypothetical protein n=1 Tax=uncultured Devosia sp. TaxID=211434 RepID=UPI0035CAD30E